MMCRRAFSFVYEMEKELQGDAPSPPRFKSWIGNIPELPNAVKKSSIQYPEGDIRALTTLDFLIKKVGGVFKNPVF